MGLCTRRHFVLTICILQLISTVERQVFDFLGTMWGPILANFFQIIFVIFGFFGTHQFRPRYIIAYLVWSILWIGWNIFIVCFYLNVGILNKDEEYNLLNFRTGAVSWWEVNGFGCRPSYATNFSNEDISHPIRPESVSGCILNYEYVEVLHAAIQVILAILGGCGAVHFLRVLVDEDDSFDFLGGFDTKSPQHLALHPTYVRVPTHNTQSFLRSSQQRLTFNRQDSLAQPRSFSLPRNVDSIRMCQSDMHVNKAGVSENREQTNLPSREPNRILQHHQIRYVKPRPVSVHVTTRFD